MNTLHCYLMWRLQNRKSLLYREPSSVVSHFHFFDSIQLTLFIVIISIRITEPIIFSQIFPYINNFLSDLNVVEDPKRIGFYSGLVVCFHPLLFGVVNTWTFFRRAPLRLLSCCQFITSRSSATNTDVNPSFSLV